MMTLFWSSRSPYARKALAAAYECGIADQIELVRVDIATLRPNAQVVAHNPLGKIPTLVLESGRSYFDSSVICELFHYRNPAAALFPDDVDERLTALRWQALGTGLMDVLVVGRAEAARPDGARSDGHVAAYRRKLGDILAAIEGEAGAITETPFAIGHIAIGCALDYLDFRYAGYNWRAVAPSVVAWHDTFRRRPSAERTAFVETY